MIVFRTAIELEDLKKENAVPMSREIIDTLKILSKKVVSNFIEMNDGYEILILLKLLGSISFHNNDNRIFIETKLEESKREINWYGFHHMDKPKDFTLDDEVGLYVKRIINHIEEEMEELCKIFKFKYLDEKSEMIKNLEVLIKYVDIKM